MNTHEAVVAAEAEYAAACSEEPDRNLSLRAQEAWDRLEAARLRLIDESYE